ncbi:MAG: 5-formyltetrahydrofolate cyclo-ligase [Pseudomonadota bacterium]
MSPATDKAEQRSILRGRRDGFVQALSPDDRARLEAEAAAALMPLIAASRSVAFYVALGSELGCAAAMDIAARAGIDILLPYVTGRAAPMHFHRWLPGEALESGWRGLLQPRADAPRGEPDVIVAPLVGFDSRLMRLGQGGGFYDRAFALRPMVKKIGFGWSVQQSCAIAADPWDVPLDAMVTERGQIEPEERG